MPDKLPHLLVDEREPEWVLNLINNDDSDMIARKKLLPIGDIAIGGGCIVERKEINNLWVDIFDNSSDRPWSQIRNMKDNFESCHLIVHGKVDDIRTQKSGMTATEEQQWKMKSILGCGLSIEMDWNMHFWKVDSVLDFIHTIRNLFEREIGEKRSRKPYQAVKSTASTEERIAAMLNQVPGIGPSRAKKVMDDHFNLKEIVNHSREELQEILGEKTGGNLYDVFNKEIK